MSSFVGLHIIVILSEKVLSIKKKKIVHAGGNLAKQFCVFNITKLIMIKRTPHRKWDVYNDAPEIEHVFVPCFSPVWRPLE